MLNDALIHMHSCLFSCLLMSLSLPPSSSLCMHVNFHHFVLMVPPMFFPHMQVFHSPCAALENQQCVYSTWFTCSRRTGCQQWQHQSSLICQSALMLCGCHVVCSISLKNCLTSCAWWLYLCSCPEIPAAEQSLSINGRVKREAVTVSLSEILHHTVA